MVGGHLAAAGDGAVGGKVGQRVGLEHHGHPHLGVLRLGGEALTDAVDVAVLVDLKPRLAAELTVGGCSSAVAVGQVVDHQEHGGILLCCCCLAQGRIEVTGEAQATRVFGATIEGGGAVQPDPRGQSAGAVNELGVCAAGGHLAARLLGVLGVIRIDVHHASSKWVAGAQPGCVESVARLRDRRGDLKLCVLREH
jgi:hypothetical protein